MQILKSHTCTYHNFKNRVTIGTNRGQILILIININNNKIRNATITKIEKIYLQDIQNFSWSIALMENHDQCQFHKESKKFYKYFRWIYFALITERYMNPNWKQ